MRIFLFFIALFCLVGCESFQQADPLKATAMPYGYHQTRFKYKDFKIVGFVRGEYSKNCVLFGLICGPDMNVYDDLLRQGREMGADEVINIVMDTNESSVLWSPLFSSSRVVANGTAVKILPK